MNGKLILARHHESEWNKLGIWTGKRDRHLTNFGFQKSADMGLLLQNIPIDQAFASMQVRSIETLSCILNVCKSYEVPTLHSAALNERDYGIYTGKNKWQMEKLVGETEFKKIRRSWDYPIPEGESLKDVYNRTVPYYLETIMPSILSGKNTLVVAHGNSLRSLLKYIEHISDEDIIDVEFPFGTVMIYDVDNEGRMKHKEIRKVEAMEETTSLQIIATIGPSSGNLATLEAMVQAGVDAIRLNFSWGTLEAHKTYINEIRTVAKATGKRIPIIVDLPGPRLKTEKGHTLDKKATVIPTVQDLTFVTFAAKEAVDYVAVSFVSSAEDVKRYREAISKAGGAQKIIAKIERPEAVTAINEIIEVSDAVMIARGDLGDAVPFEQIPFIQRDIVERCNGAGKPVIVATQMLLSMTEHITPTRAEVSDVADAIIEGADAVMLSEETAQGQHPIETSAIMERIVGEARKHLLKSLPTHPL